MKAVRDSCLTLMWQRMGPAGWSAVLSAASVCILVSEEQGAVKVCLRRNTSGVFHFLRKYVT